MERALKAGDRVIALRYDDMTRSWLPAAALILSIDQYYRGAFGRPEVEKFALVRTVKGLASVLMDIDNLTPAGQVEAYPSSVGEWDLLEKRLFPTWLLNKLHKEALKMHEEN